jgi:hypothetical protein
LCKKAMRKLTIPTQNWHHGGASFQKRVLITTFHAHVCTHATQDMGVAGSSLTDVGTHGREA